MNNYNNKGLYRERVFIILFGLIRTISLTFQVKEEASPVFVSVTEFKKFCKQNKKELEQIRSDIYTINSKIKIIK